MNPEPPRTTVGDVVIRHDESAPSIWIVGPVAKDGALTGSPTEILTSRRQAVERARALRAAPEGRIFIVRQDGDYDEVV